MHLEVTRHTVSVQRRPHGPGQSSAPGGDAGAAVPVAQGEQGPGEQGPSESCPVGTCVWLPGPRPAVAQGWPLRTRGRQEAVGTLAPCLPPSRLRGAGPVSPCPEPPLLSARWPLHTRCAHVCSHTHCALQEGPGPSLGAPLSGPKCLTQRALPDSCHPGGTSPHRAPPQRSGPAPTTGPWGMGRDDRPGSLWPPLCAFSEPARRALDVQTRSSAVRPGARVPEGSRGPRAGSLLTVGPGTHVSWAQTCRGLCRAAQSPLAPSGRAGCSAGPRARLGELRAEPHRWPEAEQGPLVPPGPAFQLLDRGAGRSSFRAQVRCSQDHVWGHHSHRHHHHHHHDHHHHDYHHRHHHHHRCHLHRMVTQHPSGARSLATLFPWGLCTHLTIHLLDLEEGLLSPLFTDEDTEDGRLQAGRTSVAGVWQGWERAPGPASQEPPQGAALLPRPRPTRSAPGWGHGLESQPRTQTVTVWGSRAPHW